MFEAETEVVQLESRLGRVGSIQAWDPWKSRLSVRHAKWWVSKIARLSHGLEETEDFEAHFDRVVFQKKHESVLEFVPWIFPVEWDGSDDEDSGEALPGQSLRRMEPSYGVADALAQPDFVASEEALQEAKDIPASAFLVECPLYTRSQWMRHRSFSYLEMSRRYTKGSKVEWSYYGGGDSLPRWSDGSIVENPVPGEEYDYYPGHVDAFHAACEAEYRRRLGAGWPNEIARGCMPMEAMTKFWVAGFDRDWEAFLKLRNDAHAQPEIRVFAQWIEKYLEGKKASHA